jgi:superfamily I DNA/RNA helicase
VEQLISTAAFYNDLTGFLDTLAAGRGEDGAEPGAQGIRIMTIHASKGLEFDQVFVPALEEGILPFTLYGKASPEILAEEQRLLYVAMTRAKIGLYLSWARKRLYQGRVLENPPSRYLSKLETLIPLAEAREYRRGKTRDMQMELF